MASHNTKYGNTTIEENNISSDIFQSRNNSSMNQNFSTSVVDEENPVPPNYDGDITFTRTIYSKKEFNNKNNISFEELNSTNLPIEIDQFFNFYNEIFFDIPKEGENSHTTIIETSLDYVGSYNNPLQGVVDNLNSQISELEGQISTLEGEIETLVAQIADTLEGQINSQQAQAAYDAYLTQIGGDPENPIMTYSDLQIRGNNVVGSDFDDSRAGKDLRQAYEKAKSSGLKYQNRTEGQWKADVEKSSSGQRTEDLFEAIEDLKGIIKNKLADLDPNS